jgi:hypothetical protein
MLGHPKIIEDLHTANPRLTGLDVHFSHYLTY